MTLRKKILITAVPPILLAILLYVFYGQLIVYLVSRTYNLDISYKSLRVIGLKEMVFRNLVATDKKHGFGISAHGADARPRWLKDAGGNGLALDFKLRNVYFMKKEEVEKESYDDLPNLIAAPFKKEWEYEEMSGTVQILKKRFYIRRFSAESDTIRVLFVGNISYDYKIDGSLTLYFSKELTDKIPDPLSQVILQNEEGGWKSLSVNLKGDYRSPSISVTNKFFRLKIGEVKRK